MTLSVNSLAIIQGCPLSVGLLFHQCTMLMFISILLVLEGQAGAAWEPLKSNVLSDIEENWTQSTATFVFLYSSFRMFNSVTLTF